MFLAAFKGCPPTLSLLAGGASTAGGFAVGTTAAGGLAAAGAGVQLSLVSVLPASLLSCHPLGLP